MISLIKKLLEKWACMHDWSFYKEREVSTDYGDHYWRHTFICKKCGKFKQVRV